MVLLALSRDEFKVSEKRHVGAWAGGILLLIGIALDQSSIPKQWAQVTMWSLAVLTLAIVVNYKDRKEKWFWQGLALGSLLHVAVIYGYRGSFPFSSFVVPTLMGFLEAAVWQIIFRLLSGGRFTRSF